MVANESGVDAMGAPEAGRFWRFAIFVYGQNNAQAAFLLLQDEGGADVPLLLWCLWRGAEGDSVPPQAMTEAVRFSRLWRAEIVAPLRAQRRRLKPGVEGLPGAVVQAARALAATAELESERLQMAHLASLRVDAQGSSSSSAMRANLSLCARTAEYRLDAGAVEAVLTAARA